MFIVTRVIALRKITYGKQRFLLVIIPDNM